MNLKTSVLDRPLHKTSHLAAETSTEGVVDRTVTENASPATEGDRHEPDATWRSSCAAKASGIGLMTFP
jgi:hypothetical protein